MEKRIKSSDINEYLRVAMSKERDREEGIVTDPDGSYTGVPRDNPFDKPIQDADDL